MIHITVPLNKAKLVQNKGMLELACDDTEVLIECVNDTGEVVRTWELRETTKHNLDVRSCDNGGSAE